MGWSGMVSAFFQRAELCTYDKEYDTAESLQLALELSGSDYPCADD